MKVKLSLICFILGFTICACEKPEPQYRLKSEVGDVAYTHFEFLDEKTKFVKMKKNSEERRKQIRKNREIRNKSKGRYKKQSLWDY